MGNVSVKAAKINEKSEGKGAAIGTKERWVPNKDRLHFSIADFGLILR